ncbi:hypothetical protein AMECASPLE_025305 [Ameca splendens]|uniref:Uncharacterized protein n=1 Tax=Ameca splendens TaxID=208324 RepID=A0ABV0Y4H5_9TELE
MCRVQREKKSVRAVVCFGSMHNGDWGGGSAGHGTFHVQSVCSTVIKNSAASAILSHHYRSLTPLDTQVQGINPEVNNHFGSGGSISPVFPDHGKETEAGRINTWLSIFYLNASH